MSNGPSTQKRPESQPTSKRLESWKEIASYLKRDVRTVQRWEKQAGLPVHRHGTDKVSAVFAFAGELDVWRNNGANQATIAAPVPRPMAWKWIAISAVVVAAVSLGWVFRRPLIRLLPGLDRPRQMTIRKVYEGPFSNVNIRTSPDGRYMTYTDPVSANLVLRDLKSGRTRVLTASGKGWAVENLQTPSNQIFSPDGKRLVFSWANGWKPGYHELKVVEADGTNERLLYRSDEVRRIRAVDWTPDGRFILAMFRKSTHVVLVLVSVSDSSVREIDSLGEYGSVNVSFSPDGRYIAYDIENKEGTPSTDIFIISLDGTRKYKVVVHPGEDMNPFWSPEGDRILFHSNRTGTVDLWSIRVAEGRPIGEPEMVKRDLGLVSAMGFDKDGNYYYSNEIVESDVKLVKLNFETGEQITPPVSASQRYFGASRTPDWSPDGKHLVYVSADAASSPGYKNFRNRSLMLVFRDTETGKEREVRPKLGFFSHPRWYPDARSILLSSDSTKGMGGVQRVNVETGEYSNVVPAKGNDIYIDEIAWAPGGKTLYLRRMGKISSREIASGKEKPVYSGLISASALSPNGRQFAVADRQGLVLVPSGGGPPRVLFSVSLPERVLSVAWLQDGKTILFGKANGFPSVRSTELWSIPAEAGQPQKQGLTVEGALQDLRIHPTSGQLAFTSRVVKYEIWSLENILP